MSVTILQGDCIEVMRGLPDASVHCCVTSPPYYGLRDYGVDGQLGLERTPEEYVAKLVAVFQEVKRVLRDDGTLWLNLGDSYASDFKGSGGPSQKQLSNAGSFYNASQRLNHGLKPKDLIGIPWRVAFALQADGWYLRSDIIWSKPNPMPESVTDRPTRAHEYVFLMSKRARYYYDGEKIKELASPDTSVRDRDNTKLNNTPGRSKMGGLKVNDYTKRNARSVWSIATAPYKEAHFATFPPDLIKPMILAGCPESVCSKCGTPHEPIIIAEGPDGRRAEMRGGKAYDNNGKPLMGDNMIDHGVRGSFNSGGAVLKKERIGTRAICNCGDKIVSGTVLDPFAGSGTTGMVAENLGRNSILIELNPQYIELAKERTKQLGLYASEVQV